MDRKSPNRLKINTEDIISVFDKGNNSDKNIGKLTSKMSFVASAKSEHAEFLMDIHLLNLKICIQIRRAEIFGYRNKTYFSGTELPR